MRTLKWKLLLLTIALTGACQAQDNLFDVLKEKDRQLFEIGFDRCDLDISASLLTDDLEFYHDLSGVNKGIGAFLTTMREGLCKSGQNNIRRHLVPDSLAVFPLKDNGVLYGAVQIGEHQFAPPGQKPEGLPARFTHLWLKTSDGWKISRVLSYDHH